MNKIRMNINGTEVIGHSGQTILEIAKDNNIEIPTLCHDERVEPYGSCGLCIVEVEGMNKLLRSCSTVASDGMIISTNTKKVNDSRKIALELLLSDHTGDCKAPCTLACPGDTDCQGYVGLVANGEDEAAVELLKEKLPLPASIGRVCPHPCETACRRDKLEEPVSIAIIKRFVGDVDLRNKEQFMPEIKASTGKKVAIIGGGPGGLTAGYFLAKEGHKPTIYEAMPELGGMLRYGIPQYRLPKEVLNEEIEIIKNMGVEMLSNIKIGKDIKLDYIREKYDAVYVSIGAWNSTELNCPGEELDGVIGGIEFLSKFTLNKPVKTGEKIAVVGGGNTAMDACRTAIRLGAKEVYALYRRTQAEMPAEEIEIEEAMEEGVNFKFLVSPSEIIGENGKVSKVKLQKMKLGEKDARGRRRPIPIEGEFEILEVDSVISAVGQKIDIKGLEELELTQRGTIAADENSFSTNLEGVFAGGDATNKGPDIAIAAIGDAKKAVNVMNGYLEGKAVKYEKPFYVTREDVDVKEFSHRKIEHRPRLEVLDPEIRKTNFEEVVSGYSEEDARKEAMRCLECGCGDLFECKLLEFSNEYKVEPERLEGEMHNRKNDDNHPFIIRDSDKCILCGLCVRVCEDVVKSNALALIDRGFDTKVEPAFGKTLQESECVSCGMCVSVCPTGAMQERQKIVKSVPLNTKTTSTVCSHCSVGCNMDLSTKGHMITRATPIKDSSVDDGLLCAKGRFGFDLKDMGLRITNPLVRKNGELEEVSWEEAMLYIAKRTQSLGLLYGDDAMGVSISDRYTNEDIYLAHRLSKEVLKTDNIGSFNNQEGGIKEVLGYDASPNTFDELDGVDTILLIEKNIMQEQPIAGFKIKNALENGAKLISISPEKTSLTKLSSISTHASNNVEFLKEILKSLIEQGFVSKKDNYIGLEDLTNNLVDIEVSEEARVIAEAYGKSKNAMIVFEEKAITSDAAILLANMAVVSGHIARARNGIIQLKQNTNSQGLKDMGIAKGFDYFKNKIENKDIKGLLVFGEDVSDVDLEKLEFLMVQDTHISDTAKKADVVLPAVGFAETSGTITNTERKIQSLNKAIKPLVAYENWQVIMNIANMLGKNFAYSNSREILLGIEKTNPDYFGLSKSKNKDIYWPINKSRVLYSDEFNTKSKKAELKSVDNGELFIEYKNTNNLTKFFAKYLQEQNLI